MDEQVIAEHLLLAELRGVCIDCVKSADCDYRLATSKIIVQCDMHQSWTGEEPTMLRPAPQGLCANCSRASSCRLPGRQTGVWHCEEYE